MKHLFKFVILLLVFVLGCRKESSDGDDRPKSIYWGNAIYTSVTGQVIDENGNAVSGALVSIDDKNQLTDNKGVFHLSKVNAYEKLGFLRVSKQGFFQGSRSYLPKQSGNYISIVLLSNSNDGNVSGLNGGNIEKNGVKIEFQPNSFVKNDIGYSGNVNVSLKYINPESTSFYNEMPGNLIGIQNGSTVGLKSYGMIAVDLSDDFGNKVNLAPGKTAKIYFPLSNNLYNSAPPVIDLWYFDEENGYWLSEGKASIVNGKYQAEVSHFSFWNCDISWQMVKLEGQVTDNLSSPIQGARVIVTSSNAGVSFDYTNTNGNFGGYVPANEVLTISIQIDCSGSVGFQTIYTSQIGPFSTDYVISPIKLVSNSLTSVYGQVLDCNNSPILNGYIVANNKVYFLSNGKFQFLNCSNTLELTPYSIQSASSGQTQNFALNGGALNLGNFIVCNGNFVGSISDIDGNVYKTVQIGNKVWMAENLKTTRYSNGDLIPNKVGYDWSSTYEGAWVHYYQAAYLDTLYGKLYNWYAVNDARNVCPVGWHVPTDTEWIETMTFLDPNYYISLNSGGSNIAGGKMKSVGNFSDSTGLWNKPNTGATNESGFSAVPAGQYNSGSFGKLGELAIWWTSTDEGTNSNRAFQNSVWWSDASQTRTTGKKIEGLSVRCIKD